MRAYSEDLRQRIVRAVVEGGLSQPEVARRFAVGLRTVERYVRQWRTTGDLAARHSPGAPPAVGPRDYPALIAQLAADPDARLVDHCARWERERGTKVSVATMQRLTRRVGWTVKKNVDRQ
jgi:transposase